MDRTTYSLRRLVALAVALLMFATLFAGCVNSNPNASVSTEPSGTVEQTVAPTDEPTEAPTEEPTEAPTEAPTEPAVTMGIVNADNLNVRSEPYSTADILKRLAINTRVEIQEQKIVDGVNWGRIAEGWINLNYVTIGVEFPENDAPTTGSSTVVNNNTNIGSGSVSVGTPGTITATELNIREEADADSDSVGTYKKGDKVTIIKKNGDWGKTDKGWISLKYVKLDGAAGGNESNGNSSNGGTNSTVVSNGSKTILGYGTVARTTSLAIRSGPGVGYTQVSYIRMGERHAYYQTSTNGWVRMQKGWVNADYLDIELNVAAGAKGTVNAGGLNIREEADADTDSLETLKKGDEVTILEVKGEWGLIEYTTGQYGWINLNYVTFTAEYTTGTGKVTATSLNIRDKASASGKDVGSYKKGDKVTITEVSGDWGKTDKGWINLKYVEMDPVTKYDVTIATITGGKVKTTSTSYAKGATVVLTVTPDSGKELDTLTVKDANGKEITVKDNKFTMPGSKVTITATFKTQTAKYTVTLNKPTGGKVSANTTSCISGTEIVLTVTPDSGYVLKNLTAMNTTSNTAVTVTGGKFTMPAGNVNVVAEFEKTDEKTYTITSTSDRVAVSTSSAKEGTDITLTVTPKDGYRLSKLTVMNVSANAEITATADGTITYTFKMPAANVTVAATFEEATYKVNITQATGGTVSADKTEYKKGDKVTLTVTPVDGYKLTKLVANATDITSTSSFVMPGADANVTVVYEKLAYALTVNAGSNGSVAATVDSTVATTAKVGDTVTLTTTPAKGYELDAVTVKDAKDNTYIVSGTGNVRTFDMPATAVTVTVTFKYTTVKYKVVNTNGDFVNIRKAADSASEDLGDIPNDTIVESLEGSTESWIKVTYNNVTGWVGIGNLDKVTE